MMGDGEALLTVGFCNVSDSKGWNLHCDVVFCWTLLWSDICQHIFGCYLWLKLLWLNIWSGTYDGECGPSISLCPYRLAIFLRANRCDFWENGVLATSIISCPARFEIMVCDFCKIRLGWHFFTSKSINYCLLIFLKSWFEILQNSDGLAFFTSK